MKQKMIVRDISTFRELAAKGKPINADVQLQAAFTTDEAKLLSKKDAEELSGVGDAERVVRFVISTQSVDRDKDTIDPSGWDLANYVRNPTVLWAHDARQPPIGRALSIEMSEGKLVSVAEFVPREISPLADTIFQMIKGGWLKSASVGFKPKRWSYNEERRGVDFLEQELLEWSVVSVPSNPDALVEARDAGIDMEPVRAWAKHVFGDDYLIVPKAAKFSLAISSGLASETMTTNSVNNVVTLGTDAQVPCSEDEKCGRTAGADACARGDECPMYRAALSPFAKAIRALVSGSAKAGSEPPDFGAIEAEVMRSLPAAFAFDPESGGISLRKDIEAPPLQGSTQEIELGLLQLAGEIKVPETATLIIRAALTLKRGRILARRNEARLRQAADNITSGQTRITEVLEELKRYLEETQENDAAPPAESKGQGEADLDLTDLDDMLDLGELESDVQARNQEGELEIDPAMFRQALREEFDRTLGSKLREMTEEIAALSGRAVVS